HRPQARHQRPRSPHPTPQPTDLATPNQLNSYPHRPPSLLFAPAIGQPTSDARGWPAASGYRAPNDICKPFTAEGQALHAEWATGPHAWRNTGNPFLFVVENLVEDINRVGGARAA
ncbi:hypothetical protein AB0873_32320, partial [Micromonospora sp. NPDC047707]|uniref:hypothetical protein n=1 Tax=Micromonospora sp. NPDC047707 TaxID=3154498 RepID=UPI0034557233